MQKLSPVAAILLAWEATEAYQTALAVAYRTRPADFAGLTVPQQASLGKLAARVAVQGRAGWVHQTFKPRAIPGNATKPMALQELYDSAVKAGLVEPPLPYSVVENGNLTGGAIFQAVKDGKVETRPTRGGFVVCRSDVAKTLRDATPRGSKTPVTPESVAATFKAMLSAGKDAKPATAAPDVNPLSNLS